MWHPWKRRIAQLQARVEQLAEQRDNARRELAESRATIVRLAGRNSRLTELLEVAQEAAQDGALDEMGRRLDRALRACARYRAEAAEDRAAAMTAHQRMKQALAELDLARVTGRTDLIRRLDLAERARRSLAEQLATVQAANDAMCRERVPTTRSRIVPKPSEVTR
ncbi:hypothetical protein AB0E27_20290 [Streptomyces sparsogenes]|uniref:hypothetical protein n=1 Tax=Streptomyces sparsogenes TaxID=67365 RepID=UPI00340B2D12